MKRKDNELFHYNSQTLSDRNISRLVKLAGDPRKPGRAFTESLTDSTLYELKQSEVEKKNKKHIIIKSNLLEKAIGWAAMIAVACGAVLSIVLSSLLKMNFFLEIIFILTMFFNWIIYLGGRIL